MAPRYTGRVHSLPSDMRTAIVVLSLLLQSPVSRQDPEPTAAPTPYPEVGKAAPALRLNDHHGHAVAIGGAAETWTVLAFYPKAATPG